MNEQRPPKKDVFGVLKGRVQLAPDFDGPLPADVQELFERAHSAGEAVHEPGVKTRVQAALEAAGVPPPSPYQEHLAGEGVVLFVDIDGVLAPQGASRIDDGGQLTGEGLFRWWPQLRQVLDEHLEVAVVIHSSWARLFGPLPYLKRLLPADLAARVVDMTSMDEHRRAQAVQDWVDAHAGELRAYVVVDDCDDFPGHVTLVHCDPQRGLSDPAKVQELRAALAAAERLAEAARQDAWRGQRSRALTEAAIAALQAHPERLAAVANTLERWTAAQGPQTQARAEAWRRVLADKAWEQALEDAERGQWLRSFSPLVSALDEQERQAIRETFEAKKKGAAGVTSHGREKGPT